MNNFEIKPINNKEFSIICFSLDLTRPDCYYEKIEEAIKFKNKSGIILLDLYQANPNSKNRFFKIPYADGMLQINNISKIKIEELPEEILTLCNHFYEELEESALFC